MSKGKRIDENGDGGIPGMDDSALASAISNGEDLAPFIRAAFEIGKPEALIHQLKSFVKKKEVEIEDLCKLHYSEFIRAVDELRYVLVDAEELKSGLAEENKQLQEVGDSLLRMLDALIQSHGTKRNLMQAIDSLKTCTVVVDLCLRANEHIMNDNYYPALKVLDILERDYMPVLPARALRQVLERQIPVSRAHVERKVNKEFNDWLVHIRSASREIGQLSIGQASSARQREEEIRGRQRRAEEQSRSGSKELVYFLETEDVDDDDSQLKFDLTPVYRAYHINTCLGMQDQFKEHYFKNRQLQLKSDLEISTTQSFLESHQSYFAQLAGFFIVEDRVLRSAGGLMTSARTEQLWELAISRVSVVMEDQFSRMQDASYLLLVKDYVSLLGATLRRHGYQVGPLMEVLDKMRDKYHELLIADRRNRINDVLANDKYEKMMMRKEYEYNMNVLSFHLQTMDVMPAFPYIAPFSATVPECCRIVRSFIEDSVSFLAYGGHIDYYDLVKMYLDKFLVTVLNEALLRLVRNPTLGVSHAMQIAANMTVLETACSYFAQHAAKLCGIPTRLVEGPHGALSAQTTLRNSQAVAHDTMIKLVKTKADEFMSLTMNINWTPDEQPQVPNDYLDEVNVYLQTIAETSQEILPPAAFYKLISGVLEHIATRIMETLLSEDVKKFNLYAMMGLDIDLKMLENFADEKFQTVVYERVPGAQPLKAFLAEVRQIVNLFLATQPDLYLNPVIRERNYNVLDPREIIIIGEKFRDLPEKMFGAGRGGKVVAKKKLIDALIKRLKSEV